MQFESETNMMVRFLIHFLFTEHDHKIIDLFDVSDPIFENFKIKQNANAMNKDSGGQIESETQHAQELN